MIDKIQNRVTHQQQQTRAAVTATNEQALKYLDKSKLDEIAMSSETQALIASLLQTLGVVESEVVVVAAAAEEKEPLQEDYESDIMSDESCSDNDEDGSNDSQQQDIQDTWLEQSDALRGAGRMEYEDYQEDLDVDGDELVRFAGDMSEHATLDDDDDETAESEEEDEDDDESAHDPKEDSLDDNKAFLHLTQQLSFSKEQASRACNAIDGWDEAAAPPNNGTLPSSKTTTSQTNRDDKVLELAMDWLCLHLTEEELTRGFRPNANPPQQHQQIKNDNMNKVRAVPHPSISIISKPIAEQAKEWAHALRIQERTFALVRLGFHHAEALVACDETSQPQSDTMDTASWSAEYDPALPGLLQKMRDEVRSELDLDVVTAAVEGCGDESAETLQEERDQELEALEAIYAEQLQVLPDQTNVTDGPKIISRYKIEINPLEPLQSPAKTDDCILHILVPNGYPMNASPLLLFNNPSLPPTFLRRINVTLLQKAQELMGNPVVFELVSFLEAELSPLHNDFVKEQRRKEFEAEQVRLRRQRQAETEQSEKLMEAQYQIQYDPNGEGAKLGRRQKAKLRAAERAYDRPDQTEELYREYRKKQDARVEQAKEQSSRVRATYAQLAIERRQQELVEEEAERAARSAMTASLNRGGSVEEARKAAKKARTASLRENGIETNEEEDDNISAVQKISFQAKSENSETEIEGKAANQPNSTSKSSMFMDRLRNTAAGETNAQKPSNSSGVDTKSVASPVSKARPTEQTSAFMDRLREMYENAANNKSSNPVTKGGTTKGDRLEKYHLDLPDYNDEPEAQPFKVPRPVAIATGELADVMKDVINQQEEQPWLISKEARAPTLSQVRQEVTSTKDKRKSEISTILREDLERKSGLAIEWGEKTAENLQVAGTDKRKHTTFSPDVYYRLMKQRQR